MKSERNEGLMTCTGIQYLNRRWLVVGSLLVIGILLLNANQAYAVAVAATYDNHNCTVTVTAGGATYDHVEVECGDKDAVGDFAIGIGSDPGWTVDKIVTRNNKTYISVVHNGKISSDQTIIIKDNFTKLRGGQGKINLINTGGNPEVVQTGSGKVFVSCLINETPTVSEWGLIIMTGLLLTVGATVIWRRFKVVSA